jgi:chromosome segregation ATPase
MRELTAELSTAAGDAMRQAEGATQAFRSETETLVETARQATEQVTTIKTAVGEQMDELGRLAQRSGELAQSVQEMMHKPVAELTAAADLAEGRAEKLRADVAAIAAAAEQAGRQLAALGPEIDANAGGIGAKFDEQAGKLTDTVRQALELADGFGQHLQQQSEALVAAVSAAEHQIGALGEARQRATTDSFLRAAADLVSELNSLSLDMTSLLDADVPDDVWRRYKDGDRSVFARRLLRQKDSYVIPALAQRYEKDTRFRDLAERFTSKFEELLAQAGKADPQNVLNTAFLTADIGKLYLLIQRNLGKVN